MLANATSSYAFYVAGNKRRTSLHPSLRPATQPPDAPHPATADWNRQSGRPKDLLIVALNIYKFFGPTPGIKANRQSKESKQVSKSISKALINNVTKRRGTQPIINTRHEYGTRHELLSYTH